MTTIQHMQVLPDIRAAQQLMRRKRSQGWAALNDLFRAGGPPARALDGIYKGELIALNLAPGWTQLVEWVTRLWMPWKGKHFNAASQAGDNIFSRDSYWPAHVIWPLYHGYTNTDSRTYPRTYHAFVFRTFTGQGLADPDRQVLKLDYDLRGNPSLTVRRVVDELVQVEEDLYLGKAHLHWLTGPWQLVAYFTLSTCYPNGNPE